MNIIVTKQIQKLANSIARKSGYGFATTIVIGNKNRVVKHTSYGYRKKTNGQYVCSAYLKNFGWKNTYYQNSLTTVMIEKSVYLKIIKLECIK